jgi:deoxycytidylate deaminase
MDASFGNARKNPSSTTIYMLLEPCLKCKVIILKN